MTSTSCLYMNVLFSLLLTCWGFWRDRFLVWSERKESPRLSLGREDLRRKRRTRRVRSILNRAPGHHKTGNTPFVARQQHGDTNLWQHCGAFPCGRVFCHCTPLQPRRRSASAVSERIYRAHPDTQKGGKWWIDTNKPKYIITAQSEGLLNGTKLLKTCKNYRFQSLML